MHDQQNRTLEPKGPKGTWQNNLGREVCESLEDGKAADEAGATLCVTLV